MTDTPSTPNDDTTEKRALVASAMAIVALLVAALMLFDTGDDNESSNSVNISSASSTTTFVETTEAPLTTESPVTTQISEAPTPATSVPTTTEAPPLPDASKPAVWPWADSSMRYADPVEADTGFAIDFLGFDEPLVAEFSASDNRSGEVEIRAFESGPVTTVLVRPLTADDSRRILGSVSENAFEGTVDVELCSDGNGAPIFEGFVATGAMERWTVCRLPLAETFEFTSPGETGGFLVMQTFSSEDGSLIEASVLRIFYR